MMIGHGHLHHRRRSWPCTFFTQISLCVALYLAFYIGNPQKFSKNNSNTEEDRDLYFLSVCEGHRPLKQQTHLLKLMEKVAKIYKVKFVVNISELGEEGPLCQNGPLNFPALKIPWYTTKASREGMGYFLKQIMLPHGKILDIISMDTGSLHDFLHEEKLSDAKSNQLHWLMRTLALSNSKWRLVVGYHPLLVCKKQQQKMLTIKVSETLHQMFLEYRVNAYLSKRGCNGHYVHDEGITYIGNPDQTNQSNIDPSANGTSRGLHDDGFLLHRVSTLEIVGIGS